MFKEGKIEITTAMEPIAALMMAGLVAAGLLTAAEEAVDKALSDRSTL